MALQSSTAPSVRNMMKQSIPMNSTIPCGMANAGPVCSPPKGSRCGAALISAAIMLAVTQSIATIGDAPTVRRALTPPAPTMPPTLNRPWNPDIIGRRLARSTITAWMFMTQSSEPRPAPKPRSAATSKGYAGDCCQQREGNADQYRRSDEHAAASKPCRKSACQWHRYDRAGAEAEQQEAEGAFVQVGTCFGKGHERRPCGHSHTGDEEDDARGALFRDLDRSM